MIRFRFLVSEFLRKFIVIGISCQIFELTGYFRLLSLLTSAAHPTPFAS